MNGNATLAVQAMGAYGSVVTNEAAVFLPCAQRVGLRTVPLHETIQRCVDVTGAVLGIVLLLPLFAIFAVAVKLTSRGPVLFFQERAGLNGRPFRMLKFRTMVADAEERLKDLVRIDDLAEPVYKLKDDPRVTRVGRFLRRFGLDELPQLINVALRAGSRFTTGACPTWPHGWRTMCTTSAIAAFHSISGFSP
jgi:lipopolysaccharide/colanic/teichoic acid biosynthesis glycosyltransferase